MLSKKIFLVFSLILLIGFASAQNYGIWSHNIEINIDADGFAQISEKFHLFFPTEADKLDFREQSNILGTNGTKWQEFNSAFVPTIGSSNIVSPKIAYNESDDSYLEITYSLSEPLMSKGKETALIEEYSIKAVYLNNLYRSGIWVIPDNTRLSIELPAGAEIKDNIEPQAEIITIGSKKIIFWEGYKSGNQLQVKYVIWKKINPIVDLNEFSYFLFRTSEGAIVILAILVVVGFIVWKRKAFASKIEKFVENNTKFEEN